jgi:hypothetical protein
MAAAADRNEQIVVAREGHSLADVVVVETTRDQRRALVVHAVPDLACGIVLRMPRQHDRPRQALAELSDGGAVELDLGSVERERSNAGIGLGCYGCWSVAPGKGRAYADCNCGTAKLTSIHDGTPRAWLFFRCV